jgi:Rrf2 family protein
MLDLAQHADQGPVLCREIARRQEISEQYLFQLLLKLKRANLVKSIRGPGGGYVLTRGAAQISAGDVLAAVEEALAPVFCVDERQEPACHRVDGCPTHWLWATLGQAIRQVLDSVTLADLRDRSRSSTFPSVRFPESQVVTETRESKDPRKGLPTALDSLEAAHAFQQSIIDGIAEPIMVIGTDYRVVLMNRAAREFSSGSDSVSEPLLCYQISHRREAPCNGIEHPCPLEQVRESGQPVTVVHRHIRASGEWRLVELLAAPLRGKDHGTFLGIVESSRDITERVRAEEELRAAHAFQQKLIDEERERIARELHDGLAQLLGYVNTKAMAVRLMLKKSQVEAAEQHLLQLEEAARELYVQVREAILDLRRTDWVGSGLATTLRDYAAQFSRLCDLPVELAFDPEIERLSLAAEIELQLLRIVQESLTNVRKHASATRVWISVQMDVDVLELTVRDDGKGFDPGCLPTTHWPHFGLSTMRERAGAIGAEFYLDSKPGTGTLITVRMAVVEPF